MVFSRKVLEHPWSRLETKSKKKVDSVFHVGSQLEPESKKLMDSVSRWKAGWKLSPKNSWTLFFSLVGAEWLWWRSREAKVLLL